MIDGVPNNSLFIVLSKDSQLVDDGWCAAGERSLVDVRTYVEGGVEYIYCSKVWSRGSWAGELNHCRSMI